MQNNAMLGGFFLAQAALITMYVVALRANPSCQPQLVYQVCTAAAVTCCLTLLALTLPKHRRDILYKVFYPMQILLSVPFFGQIFRPYFNKKFGPYLFSHDVDTATSTAEGGALSVPVVVPLNIHAFQSRLCLFIMMVTGEGMIQIISPTLPESSDFYGRIVLFNSSGFVILFGNAMLYADAVIRENIYLHVMTRSPTVAGKQS